LISVLTLCDVGFFTLELSTSIETYMKSSPTQLRINTVNIHTFDILIGAHAEVDGEVEGDAVDDDVVAAVGADVGSDVVAADVVDWVA
jgi:hypothetical protein